MTRLDSVMKMGFFKSKNAKVDKARQRIVSTVRAVRNCILDDEQIWDALQEGEWDVETSKKGRKCQISQAVINQT